MAAKNPFRPALIAPCGMDCAICSAFLRTKNRCAGCRAPDRHCNRNCTIASCTEIRGRYNHECGNFPCSRLKQLDRRYRARYRMSMLENLDGIRREGIRAFMKSEKARWTCRSCGGTIDIHHYRCAVCGRRPENYEGSGAVTDPSG